MKTFNDYICEAKTTDKLSVAQLILRLKTQKKCIDKLIYGLFRDTLKDSVQKYQSSSIRTFKNDMEQESEYDTYKEQLSSKEAPSNKSSFTQEYCDGPTELALFKMANKKSK